MITELRQCESALLSYLSGFIIDEEEVNATIIAPEGEVEIEHYPAIVIYRTGAYPDYSRHTNEPFYSDAQYNDEGILLSVNKREAPTPYNLYYGIRVYYEFQQDGIRIIDFILKKFKRGAQIPIEGIKYNTSIVSYKNPNATYRQFGEQKKNEKRRFVEQYLIKLEIEFDFGTKEEIKVNREGLTINIKSK